jgi:hypothetical protein
LIVVGSEPHRKRRDDRPAKKNSLLMQTWHTHPGEGVTSAPCERSPRSAISKIVAACDCPDSNQTRKGNQMHTQWEVIELSGPKMSKDCEAAMKEEDDFMIRHGWYMSCFYEAWRNGRGRAVEKKRRAERTKWMKLYEFSTTCPVSPTVGINHTQ